MNTLYRVWAESSAHSTYAIAHSYNEARKTRQRLRSTFGKEYTYSIEKI